MQIYISLAFRVILGHTFLFSVPVIGMFPHLFRLVRQTNTQLLHLIKRQHCNFRILVEKTTNDDRHERLSVGGQLLSSQASSNITKANKRTHT